LKQLLPWIAVALFCSGCAAGPRNPSFLVSYAEANRAIDEMRDHPKALQRPLVVIGGFGDPNVSPPLFEHCFRSMTGRGKIIPVSIGFCQSFEDCRRKVIEAVEKACPSGDPTWTAEVDVVGASLGGLVARYAAAPTSDAGTARRLRIARLFTISSPHAGSVLADQVALTQFHRDLRTGSPFMVKLAQSDAAAGYALFAYVHLKDEIVGPANAAPPGATPYWLAGPAILPAHGTAMFDPRILADIGRHLRGETPFITPPPTPLPVAGIENFYADRQYCF
jgi:hypothetical protein